MAKNRGDFDDEEGFFESLMNRRDNVPMPESMVKMIKGIVATSVLLIVALIAWAVWPSGDGKNGDNVPIVRAESRDYKVEAEEKGGMLIPNKDSTIFETIDNNAPNERKVESLLEDSEKPLKKEEVFVQERVEEPVAQKADAAAAALDEKIAEIEETEATEKTPALPVDKVKPEPAPVVKAETKEVVKEEPKEKVNIIDALKAETGTKTAEPVKAAAPKGNVYIQLASVKSDADAKKKWADLKSKYSSLAPLSLKVQKADLGAKGTFYRVQAGPTSADNAKSICAKIKAAKGDCLVAK